MHNLGPDVNPFAVLPAEGKWRFRYTGHLLRTTHGADTREALVRLECALRSQAVSFVLEPGEAVVIDQHKIVHGRGALGKCQEDLNSSQSRLMWQRFVRLNRTDANQESVNLLP